MSKEGFYFFGKFEYNDLDNELERLNNLENKECIKNININFIQFNLNINQNNNYK